MVSQNMTPGPKYIVPRFGWEWADIPEAGTPYNADRRVDIVLMERQSTTTTGDAAAGGGPPILNGPLEQRVINYNGNKLLSFHSFRR